MDLKKIEAMMKLMRKHSVTHFEYECKNSGEHLKLKSSDPDNPIQRIPVASPSHLADVPVPGVEGGDKSGGVQLMEHQTVIRSPFVGTFYEAPSPGSAPFVKVGQKIKKGEVLCIVEAMKLMNEIESERDGVIVEILLSNGQALEYNQPIYIIE